MKKCAVLVSTAVLLVLSSMSLWSQTVGVSVEGKVSQEGQPLAGVQVVLVNPDTGRSLKTKTDKNGKFSMVGVPYGSYEVQVLGANGEKLFKQTTTVGSGSTSSVTTINIDVPKGGMPPDDKTGQQKMTKEQQQAESAKLLQLNEFIKQYQAAAQAQKWQEAEKALQQLLAANPNTTRWEFYKALGDAQGRNNEWPDAIKSYDQAIQVAESIISGKAPKDPGNPTPDPARAKAGISQMLIAEGNAYVKLDKPELAGPLFQQATQDNPNPGLAYYNLCAVQFNANKMDDAAAACDKSIASDPSRALAWFFKGSALYKASQSGSGKAAPPGAAEALNKYLQLDPDGSHAAEAKTILQTLAQK